MTLLVIHIKWASEASYTPHSYSLQSPRYAAIAQPPTAMSDTEMKDASTASSSKATESKAAGSKDAAAGQKPRFEISKVKPFSAAAIAAHCG